VKIDRSIIIFKLLSKRIVGSLPMVGSTPSKITKEQALGTINSTMVEYIQLQVRATLQLVAWVFQQGAIG
jgi:hypothetical protein